MFMEDLLFQYNPWWEEEFNLENIIVRDKYVNILKENIENKHIVFLTGLRRVGKTTLMKLIIKYLLDMNINKKNILYVSVDDYLLKNKNLFEIIDEYKKIHRIKFEEKIYVFFDEITFQNEYHQQLKNLYDKLNIKIYATSSSSSLLKDKKAYLTGRSITLEVKPLDFEEYKIFKNIEVKQRDNVLNDSYFRDYMRDGGLPENVLNPNREYLMNLVDDIIQKDIIAFHGLKNHQILRDYFILLMERSRKQLSINKIANILKISPDTSRRYLYYFEETFLIHLVSRWGKTNERILSSKKIYACDLGIKHLFMGERDLGSYFENYIYLKLRNNKEVYYLYEDGNEIDFITSDKILIESKFNAEIKGKQKELFDSFDAKQKIVIDSINKLHILDEI
ncbi:MAG: ATP-binding protein [Spirochaetaceae bacterium]|nr:ATP-binding protein [Spirochaetaceae bacterium]